MTTATVDPTSVLATVTLDRAALAHGLRAATGLKSKTVHLACAEGSVRLSAFTRDTSVHVGLGEGCDGDTYAVLPRTTLAGILPYCGPELELRVMECSVIVTSGCSEFEINLVASGDAYAETFKHPNPADATEIAATYDAPTLVEILRRVLPFASRDVTRPVLCGTVLYPVAQVAAATDSYRLAVVRHGDKRRDINDEQPIYLGVHGALSIQRMLGKQLGPVEIRTGPTHVAVQFEDVAWTLRREAVKAGPAPKGGPANGYFPNWQALIPDPSEMPTVVKVDREELLHDA